MPPLMLARPRSKFLVVCAGSDDGNESSTNMNRLANRMQLFSLPYFGHRFDSSFSRRTILGLLPLSHPVFLHNGMSIVSCEMRATDNQRNCRLMRLCQL